MAYIIIFLCHYREMARSVAIKLFNQLATSHATLVYTSGTERKQSVETKEISRAPQN